MLSKAKYIVFIAGLILLLCSEALSQTNFADTRAAQAFKAENYQLALEEFKTLAKGNPNNPLILRYLAITLQMLGQYEQAVDEFNKALELSPDNPATFYHLGVTLYLSQQFGAAKQSFDRVIELVPQTEYAQSANQYQIAIQEELELLSQRQSVKAFSLYAQVGAGYDDNISALPDLPEYTGLDTGSGSGNGYLSLKGYFLRDYERWLGTAEVSGYYTGYFEDDFQALDSGTYSGSLAIQNTGIITDLPYLLEAKYLYQHVDIDRDVSYSRSNIFSVSSKVYWGNNYAGKLTYNLSDDDFDYDGAAPEFTSRDGLDHRFTFTTSFFSDDGLNNLDIGLTYNKTNADGLNFDVDGYEIFVEGEIPLIWNIRGAVNVSYGRDNYPNFSGPKNRETDILGLELRFTRWIGSQLFLSLDFGFHDEDSNYETLSYDRKLVGLNLGFSY